MTYLFSGYVFKNLARSYKQDIKTNASVMKQSFFCLIIDKFKNKALSKLYWNNIAISFTWNQFDAFL